MKPVQPQDAVTFDKLKEARAGALLHYRLMLEFHRERRAIIERLLAVGYNRADIARELNVSRQSVQKMMAAA